MTLRPRQRAAAHEALGSELHLTSFKIAGWGSQSCSSKKLKRKSPASLPELKHLFLLLWLISDIFTISTFLLFIYRINSKGETLMVLVLYLFAFFVVKILSTHLNGLYRTKIRTKQTILLLWDKSIFIYLFIWCLENRLIKTYQHDFFWTTPFLFWGAENKQKIWNTNESLFFLPKWPFFFLFLLFLNIQHTTKIKWAREKWRVKKTENEKKTWLMELTLICKCWLKTKCSASFPYRLTGW